MNNAIDSPLRAIQGDRIRDAKLNEILQPVRGRSPRKSAPNNIAKNRFLSSKTYSPSTPGITTIKHVSIPTKPRYVPQLQIPKAQPAQPVRLFNGISNERWRKVIVTRFLLANGNIVFKTGTTFGGIVTKDRLEVPLAEILDHVTPSELERFENEEFLAEDVLEEDQASMDALQPPKKKQGRPVGWRKDAPFSYRNATPREVSAMPPPTKTFSRLAVVVPSFNGPKPSHKQPATVIVSSVRGSSESSSAQSETDLPSRVPAYSMMQASGLDQVEESQDEAKSREVITSRDESPDELGPSPKRRRVSNGLSYKDTISPLAQLHQTPNQTDFSPHKLISSESQSSSPGVSDPADTAYVTGAIRRSIPQLEDVDVVAMFEAEVERETLLRRFLPNSARESSQLSDVSSDVVLGAASSPPRKTNAHPCQPARNTLSQSTKSHPPRLAQTTPPTISHSTIPMTMIPAPASVMVHQTKHSAHRSIPRAKSVSSPKAKPRRLSMTPHFPHGVTPSPSKQLNGSLDTERNSLAFPTNNNLTTHESKPITSPSPRSTNPQASRPIKTNGLTTSKRLELGPPLASSAKDLTAYFASAPQEPKLLRPPVTPPKTTNKTIPALSKRSPRKLPPRSSRYQSQSESDDPLSHSVMPIKTSSPARQRSSPAGNSNSHASQSSSSDSMSSEVLVVHRAKQIILPRDGRYHRQDDQHQLHNNDSDFDEDQDEVSLLGPVNRISDEKAAPKLAMTVPAVLVAPQLRGGQYVEEEESKREEEKDSGSSESDSCSSEVLVVRRN